jgi:hypothetical protein
MIDAADDLEENVEPYATSFGDLLIGEHATSTPATTSFSSWGDFGQPKPDQWRCGGCRILNMREAIVCIICHKPVSDAATSEPSVNTGVGTIGSEGFTFDGSSSSLGVDQQQFIGSSPNVFGGGSTEASNK